MNDHHHHNLIRRLVAEIRRLRKELEEAQDCIEMTEGIAYRAERRAVLARQRADYYAAEVNRLRDW